MCDDVSNVKMSNNYFKIENSQYTSVSDLQYYNMSSYAITRRVLTFFFFFITFIIIFYNVIQ